MKASILLVLLITGVSLYHANGNYETKTQSRMRVRLPVKEAVILKQSPKDGTNHRNLIATANCSIPQLSSADLYCNVKLIAKYSTINADGTMLRVPLFNETMPGPAIRCKHGSILRAEVINEMQSEELSVNWHGIANFYNNKNDGVAYVTEYPISPGGGSRVYEVKLDSEGTFSYNAYQEFLKMSLHGIIIVDSPTCDPLLSSYVEEAVVIQPSKRTSATYPAIVATDWYHHSSAEITAQ